MRKDIPNFTNIGNVYIQSPDNMTMTIYDLIAFIECISKLQVNMLMREHKAKYPHFEGETRLEFAPDKDFFKTLHAYISKVINLENFTVQNLITAFNKDKNISEDVDNILQNLFADDKELLYKSIESFINHVRNKAAIPKANQIRAKKHLVPNNKAANMLPFILNKTAENGCVRLRVGPPNKKPIITVNSLIFDCNDPNVTITGRQTITAFDQVVLNSAITLYIAGNEYITPAQIYSEIHGYSDRNVSDKSIKDIVNSIDKLSFMKLTIDCTAEAKARGWKLDEDGKVIKTGYLLPAETCTIIAGGVVKTAINIIKTPVLYEYALLTRQIISVPIGLLNTTEVVENTQQIAIIKERLLRRIERMYNNKKQSRRILYNTLFKESGITISNRERKLTIRRHIKAMLNLWIMRDEYIKGFKEYKSGRDIIGIEIILKNTSFDPH